MLNRMRELLRDEQGFTLVELMVVIVILGILAGIGIPTYNNFVKRAYQAEVEVAARTLKLGLELYRLDQQDYPADSEPVSFDSLFTVDGKNQREDYISDWPEDKDGNDIITLSKYNKENRTFSLTHNQTEKEYDYTF